MTKLEPSERVYARLTEPWLRPRPVRPLLWMLREPYRAKDIPKISPDCGIRCQRKRNCRQVAAICAASMDCSCARSWHRLTQSMHLEIERQRAMKICQQHHQPVFLAVLPRNKASYSRQVFQVRQLHSHHWWPSDAHSAFSCSAAGPAKLP